MNDRSFFLLKYEYMAQKQYKKLKIRRVATRNEEQWWQADGNNWPAGRLRRNWECQVKDKDF